MHISDAVLIGVLLAIITHHSHLRHGPRAARVARVCVVDEGGQVCMYRPVVKTPL
jgi:hypothetical protein